MKTSLLLLATLTLAALPACSGEARTIGMEEALEGIPESERLASFLGLAFDEIRLRQLERRPEDQFQVTPSTVTPDPLVTKEEAEELHALLDAAASGTGWEDYRALDYGSDAEGRAQLGRARLGELSELVVAVPDVDLDRCAILVEVFRERLAAGNEGAWLEAYRMAEGLHRTPLLMRYFGDWKIPESATKGYFVSIADKKRDIEARAAFLEQLDAAGNCIECLRNVVADNRGSSAAVRPDKMHTVDSLLWRMSEFASWQTCESCSELPPSEGSALEEPYGQIMMRPATFGAQFAPPPGHENWWPAKGDDYTLGPATRIPVAILDVIEDRKGKPAISVTVPPELAEAFTEYTAERVGKLVAIVVDGRVLSTPEINSPLTGGFVVSGEGDGWTAAEMRMLQRAVARTAAASGYEEVLGAGAD